jgi:hypothetical protein
LQAVLVVVPIQVQVVFQGQVALEQLVKVLVAETRAAELTISVLAVVVLVLQQQTQPLPMAQMVVMAFRQPSLEAR